MNKINVSKALTTSSLIRYKEQPHVGVVVRCHGNQRLILFAVVNNYIFDPGILRGDASLFIECA